MKFLFLFRLFFLWILFGKIKHKKLIQFIKLEFFGFHFKQTKKKLLYTVCTCAEQKQKNKRINTNDGDESKTRSGHEHQHHEKQAPSSLKMKTSTSSSKEYPFRSMSRTHITQQRRII